MPIERVKRLKKFLLSYEKYVNSKQKLKLAKLTGKKPLTDFALFEKQFRGIREILREN